MDTLGGGTNLADLKGFKGTLFEGLDGSKNPSVNESLCLSKNAILGLAVPEGLFEGLDGSKRSFNK